MFIHDVNTACINGLFSARKCGMHPSMPRLLKCAREATQGQRGAITDFKDLGARLGESSAVITNWKSRGISKAGALKASRLFGCSATWLMDGKGDPGPLAAAEPSEPESERDELLNALEVLTKALANTDDFTRDLVSHSLSRLGKDSSETVNISHKIADLLVTKHSESGARHDSHRATPKEGVLIGGSAFRDLGGHDGRSDRDAEKRSAKR